MNPTTTILNLGRILLIAYAIFTQPAMADGVPGQFVPDPVNPNWRPSPSDIVYRDNGQGSESPHRSWDVGRTSDGYPVVVYGGPGTDGYGRARIYDEPIGGSTVIIVPGNPPILNPDKPSNPIIPVIPVEPESDVPCPLGIFGVGAAFAYSRKLRNRIALQK